MRRHDVLGHVTAKRTSILVYAVMNQLLNLLILGIAKRLTLSLFLVHVLMVQNGKHQKDGQKYVMGTLTLAYAVIMQLLK